MSSLRRGVRRRPLAGYDQEEGVPPPGYNTIKYKNYPKGTDGLFGTGLTRYCFVIGEELTFHGPGATIVGGFHAYLPASNDADGIFVEGEEAKLVKAEDMRRTALSNDSEER